MRNLLALVIVYLPIFTSAQAPDYPKDYFRNPLNIPISLAGNFGECRPGHFHSGIDIKTQGKENLPVFAAADGFISRIKMEPGGFGHALYVTHPNGYTTLYAHLNDFKPEVQKYVREKQYASESWTQDLTLTPDQFPVKKGEQIAWSGNTGGSTAPHLHFEIRDTKTEHPLNPQLFGYDVPDKIAPKIQKLAIYDMRRSIYQFTPGLFPVRSGKTSYGLEQDTVRIAADRVGIGLIVDDYMDGSTNTLAFYTAEWYLDDVLQGRIRMDDIGYEETRYLNAYADYRMKQNGQPWIQCLFRLPGNGLGKVYENLNTGQGLLKLKGGAYQNLRVELRDVAGNTSVLRFTLQSLGDSGLPMDCFRPFEAGQINRIDTLGLYLEADAKAFYDAVCVEVASRPDNQSLSDRFMVGNGSIPVHTPIQLRLKARTAIPFALRSKIVLRSFDGKKESGTAAKPVGQGSYEARVRSLGEFRLLADTTAPKIEMIRSRKSGNSNAGSLAFRVKEDLTSVGSFRAELDGKWILFEQHGDVWTYEFDNHCKAGPHLLRLKAVDESGNAGVKELRFVR